MLEAMLAPTRLRALLAAVGAAALLAACGVPPLHRSVSVQTDSDGLPVHASGRIAHDSYTVVRGDTLYSIAFRANVDYRRLARWNGIPPPYVIHPGQVLRLTRPAGMSTQAAQVPVFRTVAKTPPAAPAAAPPMTPPSAPVTAPTAPKPAASAPAP